MWPIQLVFLFFIVCTIFLSSLILLLHLPHDRFNRSPSFSGTTFQNFPGDSDLISEVSSLQHHIHLYFRRSILLVSSHLTLPAQHLLLHTHTHTHPHTHTHIYIYVYVYVYLCVYTILPVTCRPITHFFRDVY